MVEDIEFDDDNEEDFHERVETLGNQIAPALEEEEHVGICVYALMNAMAHELKLMVEDFGASKEELLKRVQEDLEEILDWQLEVHKKTNNKKVH